MITLSLGGLTLSAIGLVLGIRRVGEAHRVSFTARYCLATSLGTRAPATRGEAT